MDVLLKWLFYLVFFYDEEVGCVVVFELIEVIKDFYDEKFKYVIIGELLLL